MARIININTVANGNAARIGSSKANLVGTKLMSSSSMARRPTLHRFVTATASPIAPNAAAPTTVDDNAVLDTVIVGAGVSGLTTAMVRKYKCTKH